MEWHRVCVVSIEYVPEPAISVYLLTLYMVSTSSGNYGKPGKSLIKVSMHGKIMKFEKT